MSELHDAARRLGDRALILHPASKRPMGNAWQRGQSPAVRERLLAEHPDANLGCLTGSGLAVVDVDGRDGFETLAALERQNGGLPETYRVLTGGGGNHHYFRARDAHLTTIYLPTGVELRAKGAQVVAPPSKHPSGRLYVDDPSAPSFGTFAWLPEWLECLAATPEPLPRSSARPSGDVFGRMTPARYALLIAGATPDHDGYIACPSPLHPPERTPSLKLYATAAQGWTCWRSCCMRDRRHAGGTIWDFAAHVLGFTAELRGSDFLAVQEWTEGKIASALGVTL
jgi:Bifunctional DNA primase/polymerase, N-terminal